jgi:hypothetical protein
MKKLTAFLEPESAIRDCSVAPNFLCSAAQTFGKEWETVSVSGSLGRKTTTMKAIENIVSDFS